MPTVAYRACALSVLGLLVAVAAGCSSMPSIPMLGREKPDVVPGVTPPSERVSELRKLREGAASATAEQKEQVASRLAGQIPQETDPSLRAEIVRTLAEYPTDQGRRILRGALQDTDRHVRLVACEAWGQVRGPEAVELLGEALTSDSDVDVRLAAAKALGQTGDPAAAAALAPALADSDPAMQYRATISLRQVTGQDLGTVAAWRRHLDQAITPESRPTAVAERPRATF